MGLQTALDNMIEEKLLSVHTAFIGKVLSVSSDGKYARVQPLNLIKAVKNNAKEQAVLDNVPISKSARKFTTQKITVSVSGNTGSSSVSISGSINNYSGSTGGSGVTINGSVSQYTGSTGEGGDPSHKHTMTHSHGDTFTGASHSHSMNHGHSHSLSGSSHNHSVSLSDTITVPKVVGVEVGDLVYCLCSEREIENARRGVSATPTERHHDISDSIVIAII